MSSGDGEIIRTEKFLACNVSTAVTIDGSPSNDEMKIIRDFIGIIWPTTVLIAA